MNSWEADRSFRRLAIEVRRDVAESEFHAHRSCRVWPDSPGLRSVLPSKTCQMRTPVALTSGVARAGEVALRPAPVGVRVKRTRGPGTYMLSKASMRNPAPRIRSGMARSGGSRRHVAPDTVETVLPSARRRRPARGRVEQHRAARERASWRISPRARSTRGSCRAYVVTTVSTDASIERDLLTRRPRNSMSMAVSSPLLQRGCESDGSESPQLHATRPGRRTRGSARPCRSRARRSPAARLLLRCIAIGFASSRSGESLRTQRS